MISRKNCSLLVAILTCAASLMAAHGDYAAAAAAAPDIQTFHQAVASGEVEMVRASLKDHPEWLETPAPGDQESQHLPPLHTAVEAGQVEMTRFLLDQGATIEERSNGWTPLFRAAADGQDDIIKLLLKKSADVNGGTNASDLGDITPIRAAQLYGHTVTAQLLLEKGARIDLFSAAGLGWKTYVADRLENNPALATMKDHWGSQAAWIAVNTGQVAVVDELAHAGASMTETHGQEGFTALHIAAERGYVELASWLINHGMDVHVRDNQGQTPWMYASAHQQATMMDWLQIHGGQ